MSKKIDEVKAEIARTKVDLTKKLGDLESQLRDDATVVKRGIDGAARTIQSTAKAFSVRHQVEKRPLFMLGGSILSGLVVSRWWITSADRTPTYEVGPQPRPSLVGRVARQFPDEVGVVKTVVATHLLNFLADKAKERMPDLVDKIGEIETRIKSKIESKKP